MRKILFFIFLIIFAGGFALVVFAQEEGPAIVEEETPPPEIQEMVEADEEVVPEDLEIKDPKILPDNPLYIGKSIFRGIKKALTFDPVKKAELELQYANEKIIEAKKLVEKNEEKIEKDEKAREKIGEKIEKILESSAKDIEKIEKRVEKLKEKLEDDPKAEKLVDKLTDNEFKRQKLLDKIEKDIPNGEIIEKVEEIKEKSLENLGEVLIYTKDPEEIKDKIVEVVEKQKGSDFKHFKNLEVLKKLEEKVPEQAKEAIRQAQENTFKRMEEHMTRMPEVEREKFKDYVKHIGGNEARHMEIIHDFENREIPDFIRETMEKAKEIAVERIEQRMKEFRFDEQREAFLRDFEGGEMEDLRIIKELEGNLAPDVVDKVLAIKHRAMDNFKKKFEMADRPEVRDQFFEEMERFHDVKQFEVFKEIEKVIPEDKKEFFEEMKEKAMAEMEADIERARDERERMMKFEKLAGDAPEHMAIIKEFGPPPEIMHEIMKEQAEKLARRVETIEDAQRLEFLKQRIEEEETVRRELESRHPDIFIKMDEREAMFLKEISPEKAAAQIEKAKNEIRKAEDEINQVAEQIKTMIMMRSPFQVLLEGAKTKVKKASEVLVEGFSGEAFGLATAALHEANNARRIIKEVQLREQIGQQKKEEMERHFQGEFERKFPEEFKEQFPQGPPPEGEMVCTMEWDPVCGANGRTYPNRCVAETSGVKVAYPGPCKEEEMPESWRPPEEEPFLPPEGEFPPPEEFRPPSEFPSHPFEPIKEFLEEGEMKEMEMHKMEEMREMEEMKMMEQPEGELTPCQMNCGPFYEPVCGADGRTYKNACFARCAETGVAYQGKCK